jgi:hypothetical protein
MPNAVGASSEDATQSAKKQERERQKTEEERAMNTIECIQSKKACYEAVIQSESKPKRRRSSDAGCIQ